MPITGKTPIADLGDAGDADHRIDSLLGAPDPVAAPQPGFAPAAPAASFGAPPAAVPSGPQTSSQTNLTAGAATAVAGGAESTVAHDKDSSDWINKKWRPVMGWVYMATCTADFVVFPVLWSILQAVSHGQVTNQWQPLTLQGAGLYHVAMGAVLGIAAYGRTKEKVAGAA